MSSDGRGVEQLDRLQLASDAELVHELIRRTLASERRALHIGIVRPDQDNYEQSTSLVCVSGTNAACMQYLASILVKKCGLIGKADGSIEIPCPVSGESDEQPEY